MDHHETMERKSLFSRDGEHWKSQQNFEQVEDSSGNYPIHRLELYKKI